MKTFITSTVLALATLAGAVSASAATSESFAPFAQGVHSGSYKQGLDDVFSTGLGSGANSAVVIENYGQGLDSGR